MNRKPPTRPPVRILRGGLAAETSWGGLQIVAAPEHAPPFRVRAVAREEDTFLVLSADKTVREPGEPLLRIMTRLLETQPTRPGSVLMKAGDPVRLLAVVHDLDRDPTWKESWVAEALSGILRKTEEQQFPSLALPLLGTLHGSMEQGRFISLLGSALKSASPVYLKRLWLIVRTGSARPLIEILRNELGGPGFPF